MDSRFRGNDGGLGTRAPWQGGQQRIVTSIDPFKRLPLCALIANRAAAPEVTIVSLYLPLPEPWTRLWAELTMVLARAPCQVETVRTGSS